MISEKGAMGHEALQNIGFESIEEKEMILKLLKKYLNTSNMETHERYKFFSRMKNENESIEDFIADLQERAKTCNFGSHADNFVRDKIILDTKDERLRQIFLETKNIDLKKMITIYKYHEVIRETINQICTDKRIQDKNANITPSTTSRRMDLNKVCTKCGTHHVYRNCPAFHSKCRKCDGLGHYTKMCNVYLARISYKCNKPGSSADGPFTQIDKNVKVGNNAGNKISTTSNKKQKYSSGGQFPGRIPPPKYTQYPVPTKDYNSGCKRLSDSQEKPLQTSMQNASTVCSRIKSTSFSVPADAVTTNNAQMKGSLRVNRCTSSSDIKSSPTRDSKEAGEDFAVKCCSCFVC